MNARNQKRTYNDFELPEVLPLPSLPSLPFTYSSEYVITEALKMMKEIKETGKNPFGRGSENLDLNVNVSQSPTGTALRALIYSCFQHVLTFEILNLSLSNDEIENIETFLYKVKGGADLVDKAKHLRSIKQNEQQKETERMNKLYNIERWTDELEGLPANDSATVKRCRELLPYLTDIIDNKRKGRAQALTARFNIEEYLDRID